MLLSSIRLVRVLAALPLVFIALSMPADAATIVFDFSGSGGHQPVGTPMVQSSDGVTVTVTAWSYLTSFQPASLGQWPNGIGVCNNGGNCGGARDGTHQVDNEGTPGSRTTFSSSSRRPCSSIRSALISRRQMARTSTSATGPATSSILAID